MPLTQRENEAAILWSKNMQSEVQGIPGLSSLGRDLLRCVWLYLGAREIKEATLGTTRLMAWIGDCTRAALAQQMRLIETARPDLAEPRGDGRAKAWVFRAPARCTLAHASARVGRKARSRTAMSA